MKRVSDRFTRAAEECHSLGALQQLMEEASAALGFRYFALLHHASLEDGPQLLRLDNYPRSWREEHIATGMARDDPVHFASRRSAAPFAWDQLDTLVRLDRRQRTVLERSRSFGLGNGFTVPLNIFGEPAASCSFALAAAAELPQHRLGCAALVAIHAFRVGKKLLRPTLPHRRTIISPRQRQCLRLLADGKTDGEIALILGLRPETVRAYIKHLRTAYDVVSRTQLVRFGLGDGWLDF